MLIEPVKKFMNKTENIPRITVKPKTSPDWPADKTVRVSEEEQGIRNGKDNDATTVKAPALDEQYRIIDKVGDGGMGIVYLAQDRKLSRYVAIKRLNRSSLSNPVLKERFFREAKAVAALNHIHIVHIYGLGEDADGPFIVMEYVPGPPEMSPDKTPHSPYTLTDHIEKSGALTVDGALSLMIKICRAIEYAHNCGVIHRDLKPSNVLLDESGEPKLVDFGLARRMDQEDEHLTVPGEKMLSVGYGAPEQEIDARQTDQRADVYGLGAILYFSISGKNPRYFRENDVPEPLRMPILKALETDREKRWNTVKEFTNALLLVKSPSTIELPTIKTTWRCKWCDTINPIAISYCGKCGWDGGETCAECGADTRVGIQFCGSCGADAREYEMANLFLKRMRRHCNEKSFELVIPEASRATRFQPSGQNGRKLLGQIEALGKEAQQALARRAEIKNLITHESSLKNFDLVSRYIREYNSLAVDNAFADLEKDLPSRMLNNNLEKIRQSIDKKEWDYAKRACREIIDGNPAGRSEAEFLLKVINFQRARYRIMRTATACLAVFACYVLSAAPVYRFMKQPPSPGFLSFYRFNNFLHESTVFRMPIEKYARLWGAESMFDKPVEKEPPVVPANLEDMKPLLAHHETALNKLEAEEAKKITAWQRDYKIELGSLQATMQKSGDYEGWSAVRNEMLRFEESPVIQENTMASPITELAALQKKFHDIELKNLVDKKKAMRVLTQEYEKKLEHLQKKMTMQGNMDAAATINSEIKRVKTILDSELADTQPALKPYNGK